MSGALLGRARFSKPYEPEQQTFASTGLRKRRGLSKLVKSLACNPVNQVLDRVNCRVAAVNPMHAFKKNWQFGNLYTLRQNNRNDGTSPLYELSKEGVLLDVLPRANAFGSHEHSGSLEVLDLLFPMSCRHGKPGRNSGTSIHATIPRFSRRFTICSTAFRSTRL